MNDVVIEVKYREDDNVDVEVRESEYISSEGQ